MASLPPREHIIRDILYAGCVSVLYSKPGVGKTFLAMDMAFAVAAGIAWRGLPTKKSPVIYVAGEGQSGLADRARALLDGPVKAWRIAQDIPAGVAVGLFIYPKDVQVATLTSRLAFESELHEVAQVAGDEVRFVIFDTMAACNSGKEENSVKDMTPFFEGIRGMLPNAATLILHHTGKGGPGMRGSSAIEGTADVVLRLARNDQGTLVLQGEKLRDGKFRTRYFSLREITLPNGETSCVIEDAADEMPTPKCIELLKVLLAFPMGASTKELRMATPSMSRATVYRMIADAEHKELIEEHDGKLRLTSLGATFAVGES